MALLYERSGRQNKKLKEAAKLLARGLLVFDGEDEVEQEEIINDAFAAFGIIPEGKVKVESDVFFLWPENLEAFQIWLKLRTQWNLDFSGRRVGLNYASVEQVLRWEKIVGKKKTEMIDAFRIMEAAELNALHRK